MANSYDPYEALWQQAGRLAQQAPGLGPSVAAPPTPGGLPVPTQAVQAPPVAPATPPSAMPGSDLVGGGLSAATTLGLQSLGGGIRGFQSPQQVQHNFGPALQQAEQAASGNVPTAADALAARGLNQAQRAAASTAASTRGNFGLASAERNAQAVGANMSQQAVNENAARRANEQAAAADQYNKLITQENAAEMQTRRDQQGQADKAIGSIAGAISPALAMFSDKRLKEPVGTAQPSIRNTGDEGTRAADQFLSHIVPRQFEWKRAEDAPTPEAASRPNLGVYAQDIERTPMGKTMVQDTPHGKQLDIHTLVGALAAGAGRLKEMHDEHEARLARLERAMGHAGG